MKPSNEHEPSDEHQAAFSLELPSSEKPLSYIEILQERERALFPNEQDRLKQLRDSLDAITSEVDISKVQREISNLLNLGEQRRQAKAVAQDDPPSTHEAVSATGVLLTGMPVGVEEPPQNSVISESGASSEPELGPSQQVVNKLYNEAREARVGSDLDEERFAGGTIRPNTPNASLKHRPITPPRRRPYYGKRG